MRHTYGMCMYDIDKLRKHQDGEFLELPDSPELREAAELLIRTAQRCLKDIEAQERELFIQTKADELYKGGDIRRILEECTLYYKTNI